MAKEKEKKQSRSWVRSAPSQIVGNVSGLLARGAAEEGLRRTAAHESAIKKIARARGSAGRQMQLLAQQEATKLKNIDKAFKPAIAKATQRFNEARDAALAFHREIHPSRLPGLGPEVARNVHKRMLSSATARPLHAEANAARKLVNTLEQNAQVARDAAIRRTNEATDLVRQRLSAATQNAMAKAGPKANFFQRSMAKVAQLGQRVPKPVAPAVKPVASAARATGKGLGLFASRAEIASRVAALAKTSPKSAALIRVAGKAAEGLGSLGVNFARGAARRVVQAPFTLAKPIVGLFNFGERVGQAVAGSGRLGRALAASTKASSLAGGFALGAWVDAGLNYWDFKRQGLSVDDLGKSLYSFDVVDDKGKAHTVDYKAPTMRNVLTSKKYWGEVVRGFERNLSLGFLGRKEFGWEDSSLGDQEQTWLMNGRDPLTGKPIVAEDGVDVSTIIADRNTAVNDAVARKNAETAYFLSFDPAQRVRADRLRRHVDTNINVAETLGLPANVATDVAGLTTALRSLGQQRDQKIQGIRQRVAEGTDPTIEGTLRRIMRDGKVDRDTAVSRYMDRVVQEQSKLYDKRAGLMLKSDAAAKAINFNRRAAYLTLTGRDFDVDTSADLTENAKRGYTDFVSAWGGMDTKDQVMFDVRGFQKSLEDAVIKAKAAKSGKSNASSVTEPASNNVTPN